MGTEHGSKSTQIGGSPPEVIARRLLRELVQAEKARKDRMLNNRLRGVLRVFACGLATVLAAGASAEPVNVAGGVFFNQSCAQAHKIYTVPAGKLLIIEDASASAVDSASASTPNNPGIVPNVPVQMALRTNPSGVVPMGSADHVIVAGVGLPIAGGRTVKGYAAPGTDVLFLVGGCTVPVNTNVYFSGELVSSP